jgi:hypothetical protein
MVRYSDEDIRREVAAMVAEIGTRRAAAQLGVSGTMINRIVHGQNTPGPTVAAALGYEDDGLRWIRKRRR